MATADLSADRLRELLDYNSETGVFVWRISRSNIRAGSVAGNVSRQGYIHISIDGSSYHAHMLAWLYVHGVMPTQRQIFWVNGVKTDNRIENLAWHTKSADRELTHERLEREISYNPDTGEMRWLVAPVNSIKVGSIAGAIDSNGYRRIKIGSATFSAHRLAWFMTHGNWPVGEIDHINGIRDDNRLCNLRDVTRTENIHNRKRSWSASGYLGVYRNGRNWRACLQVNGRTVSLGTYKTPEEAHAAYLAGKAAHHPTYVP